MTNKYFIVYSNGNEEYYDNKENLWKHVEKLCDTQEMVWLDIYGIGGDERIKIRKGIL